MYSEMNTLYQTISVYLQLQLKPRQTDKRANCGQKQETRIDIYSHRAAASSAVVESIPRPTHIEDILQTKRHAKFIAKYHIWRMIKFGIRIKDLQL